MTAALPAEAAGKPVEVWFTDEARVGQQGTLTRVWARRGSRPRAPRDRRYQSAYLFGAICPERRSGAAIIMPEVNIEAMSEHLAEISRSVSVGAIAVLVLDGAGWHSSPRLVVPDNIVLLPLPPHAPELNPIENAGSSCAPTFSATASGRATKQSSQHAKMPGTSSCKCPTRSPPSPSGLGLNHQSSDRAVGMRRWSHTCWWRATPIICRCTVSGAPRPVFR